MARMISSIDVLPNGPYPSYVSGKWLLASMDQAMGSGQAPGANSIRLYPFYIHEEVAIDRLGVCVTTLFAGGNIQAAIYASDPDTHMPIGNVLVSSGNMSGSATGSVEATVSVTLQPGLYWAATNCDNTTNTMDGNGSTSTWMARSIGSVNQSSCISTGGGTLSGFTFAQTFGTWPDLTGQSFTELVTSQRIPVIQFRVQ